MVNTDGSDEQNVTSHPAEDADPAWSPDGNEVVFVSTRDGQAEIYMAKLDGSRLVRLTKSKEWEAKPAWSPDGQQIAFIANASLYVMDYTGSNRRLLADPPGCDCHDFAWSHDGRWIAFSCLSYAEPAVSAGAIFLVEVRP